MSIRISDNTAITTAEIKAIDLALQKIKKELLKGKCPTNKKILICSDSLSAAEALESQKSNTSRPDLTQRIHKISQTLKTQYNMSLTLLWIPSHVGILGNEKADSLAKKALSSPKVHLDIKLGKTELVSLIKKRTQIIKNNAWQNNLTRSGYHMQSIIPSIINLNIPIGKNMKKETDFY